MLEEHAPQFQVRPQQLEMVRHVATAIENKSNLLIEAGTGTGKTFAYLVPALLADKKVIVSTATRYLQDQLFNKDVPLLMEILRRDIDIVALKGHSNYLCLEKLERHWNQPNLKGEDQSLVDAIQEWAQTETNGDISQFSALGENAPLWKSLTTTTDECSGSQCSHYDKCFVNKARRRAIRADIVIVNHYLLLADLTLKEEGFGQLLPAVECVIVDEAHQLEEIADQCFSASIGSYKIKSLLKNIAKTQELEVVIDLKNGIDIAQTALSRFVSAIQKHPERGHASLLSEDAGLMKCYGALQSALRKIDDLLSSHTQQHEVAEVYVGRLQKSLENLSNVFDHENNKISWYQREHNSFVLHTYYAEPNSLLEQRYRLYDANWIFTSATLSVNNDFKYIQHKLGIDKDSQCVSCGSVFDFKKQAILYVPLNMPEPNMADHTKCFIQESKRLLDHTHGNALFLFTSYQAMNFAAEKMRTWKKWNILVQGEAPKIELVRLFCKQADSLLLGTMGFWQGLDIKGGKMRCLFIDKLPFYQLNDPLVEERRRIFTEQGRQFFSEYVLPAAIVSLRQGVGRLIRDVSDHGVVCLGDKRICQKGYGKSFLRSLPPMPICHDIDETLPYI